MGVKHIFQQFAVRHVNNGAKTLFWEDTWVNNSPLASQFPRLFNLTFTRNVTVQKAKEEGWELFRFRRTLLGDSLAQWENLKSIVDGIQLNDQHDRVRWTIGSSGKFKVKNLYLQLRSTASHPFKLIWKFKFPLKIKKIVWLVLRNRILTKDNLLKRGW